MSNLITTPSAMDFLYSIVTSTHSRIHLYTVYIKINLECRRPVLRIRINKRDENLKSGLFESLVWSIFGVEYRRYSLYVGS